MEEMKNRAIVWAWMIKEGICYWAEPSKAKIESQNKPSPEAKPVKCMLIKYSEYLKLKKEGK